MKFFFCLFATVLFGSVDQSIAPRVEKVEIFENLDAKKYSVNQLAEIDNALKQKENRIRIVSYNMLRNDFDFRHGEEYRWSNRLPRIAELLQAMQPDIIAAQELAQDQIDDLTGYIGGKYSYFGSPREEIEWNGIFYRKERFELLGGQSWTLPVSKGKGHALDCVKLKDLKTGRSFAVFNTHLSMHSHQPSFASGADQREYEARFILDQIQAIYPDMPVIFAGDMNTLANRPDIELLPYHDGDYVHRILTRSLLKDAKDLSLLGHVGPLSTFTNVEGSRDPFSGVGTPGIFLDHFYLTPGITVLIHAVESGKVDGYFPSDHMPILMDFILE